MFIASALFAGRFGADRFLIIVMLREGLDRMSSEYYMHKAAGKDKVVSNFEGYVQAQLKEYPSYGAARRCEKLRLMQRTIHHGFYRSLYSLNLQQWIKDWSKQRLRSRKC